MLDKDLYDSWKSRMELYMQNREHERMIHESVEHGPLIWPTVEENGVIRTKKYAELSAAEKIQVDCDMKATSIILQGLPTDIYSLERECKLYDAFDKFTHIKGESLHTKFVTDVKLVKDLHTSNFDQLHAYLEQHELYANEVRFAVPVFSPGDDSIACLNKAMDFLTVVAFSRVMLLVQGEILQVDRQKLLNATTANVKDIWLGNALSLSDQGMQHGITAAVLMANISNYGSDVISEVPNSETYLNDMDNQSVHALQDFKQSPVMDFTDNEISSDSNIIPYSQYLQETQQATVQDTNLQAQQDSMILSVIEQISEQMINHVNNWEKANKE
ncbi:hypothetical protein Tco_0006784 [Tanacetum coccineum]